MPAAVAGNDLVSLDRPPSIRLVLVDRRPVSQHRIDDAPRGVKEHKRVRLEIRRFQTYLLVSICRRAFRPT